MRRLSIALSALYLLSPLAASAAYLTPSALMAAIQGGAPRSFSITAHADAQGDTYVSVWANGTLQGTDATNMQMWTKTTVDVVSGDFKVRAKGEMMVVEGMLYVKIASIDGSMKSEFATLSADFVQHKWLKTAFDVSALEVVENPAFSLSETDVMEADQTFNMETKAEKNGTSYTLTLKTDAAAQLALSIREMLQDTSSVSDDFFPWRALAEGMQFEMVVKTDAKDALLGSSYSMSTKGAQSSFTLTGTEKPAAALHLKAPADAMSIEEIGAMFSGEVPEYFEDSTTDMMEPEMTEPTDGDFTIEPASAFDSIDNDTLSSCDDSSIDAMKLLSMQRDGTCPITKTSTRYTR